MNKTRQFIATKRRLVYALNFALLIAMLVAMAMLSRAGWEMSRHHVPLVSAAHEMRIQASEFHLWFEEFLQGDRSIPAEKIWGHLNLAEWYANAMLYGGNSVEGTITPLDDPILSNNIRQALISIHKLRKVGYARLKNRSSSAIGSNIDQQFDHDFEQMMDLSVKVENALLIAINKEIESFKVFVFIIILILASSAGVARLIYIHERTRRLYEEKVHAQAFYDTLTALPNRFLFNDRLLQAMASSKRNDIYCALMFLDLDNFKPLNDLHGHDIGDMLLIEVARRLSACVREIDTVARFGGDEFVVMLSELNSDKTESTIQARIIAEKIRASLAQPYLLKVNKPNKIKPIVQHRCSASIGLVLFINHDKNSDEIVRRADLAMYQAKELGGNSIFIHEA